MFEKSWHSTLNNLVFVVDSREKSNLANRQIIIKSIFF